MIEIRSLNKKFGPLTVLDGLDVDLEKGKTYVVLGPNGSGKTTLIKCMIGMVLPDGGSIAIFGNSISKKWTYRSKVDYMPQIATFPPNLRVEELLDFIEKLRGHAPRRSELIDRFGVEPYLKKRLSNLSGGTRQKVNIVLSMMFDSELVILDEPTTGLDPVALLRLKELIQEEQEGGKTIIITTHIMSFVREVATEILFLLEGRKYFQGSIDELTKLTGEADLEHAIARILEKEQ